MSKEQMENKAIGRLPGPDHVPVDRPGRLSPDAGGSMTLLSTLIKVGGTAVIIKDIADRILSTRLRREQTLRRNKAGMLALGVAIGGTVGAVAGVLLAPQAGKETRKELGRYSGEAWEQMKERVSATSHRLVDAAEEKGSRVREAAGKGVEAARASFNDSAGEQKEEGNG